MRACSKRVSTAGNLWSLLVLARVVIVGIPRSWIALVTRGYPLAGFRTGVRFPAGSADWSVIRRGSLLVTMPSCEQVPSVLLSQQSDTGWRGRKSEVPAWLHTPPATLPGPAAGYSGHRTAAWPAGTMSGDSEQCSTLPIRLLVSVVEGRP